MAPRAAVLALALTACVAGPAPREGQIGASIVNGTDDGGRDPSVVILIGDTATSAFYSCTASLLTPRIALTAAHCVVVSEVTHYHVEFFESWDLDSDQKTGVIDASGRDVVGMWVDPDYDPILVLEGGGHDVALILLDAPVPASLVPLQLYRSRLTRAVIGQTDRFVGFGDRGDGNDRLLERQYASATIDGLTDQQFNFSNQTSSICEGDSGGPHLITVNGIEVIAGVTSTGSTTTCRGTSNIQRLDDDLPQILEYIAAEDPQPTSSCGEDGICGWRCPDIDPDCPCILDGHCDSACPTLDIDPDCPTSCDADGVCQRDGCPRADPDCGTAAVGEPCTQNATCASDLCVARVCNQTCGAGGSCPVGSSCSATTNACLPESGRSGCSLSDRASGPAALFLGLAIVLARRRRRPSPR